MSNYFTNTSQKSHEHYVTLNYLTFNPLRSNKFNSYLKNDDDDKLIIAPYDKIFTKEQIDEMTYFQEQWFESIIIFSANENHIPD